MMDEQFELLLIECLDQLQAGVPIEALLERYPDQADALRPMLETATALEGVAPAPTSAARVASRRLFLNQAADLRPARGRLAFRLAAFILAVFVCLIIGSGSIVASATALPGDTLYGVKQTLEQTRLSLASDRGSVEREIEATRRDEIQQLISNGRIADVRFRGPIEQIDTATMQIAGLTVALSPATQVIGTPAIGQIAEVAGQVRGSRVEARQIIIQYDPTNPLPTATALPSPTLTATALPSPTATATALPSPTATATATSIPTLQPTSRPTVTPRPPEPPTATLVPTPPPTPIDDNNSNDDNSNDNSGNDNSNDNSGDDNSNDNSNDNSGDDGGDTNSNDSDDTNSNDSGGGDTNSNDSDDNGGDSGSGGDSNSNDNENEDKDDSSNSDDKDTSSNNNDDSDTKP